MSLRSPVTCETIEVCWECMGMPLYSLRNGLGWVFCKLYHKHVTHHPSLAKHGQTMSNQRNPFDMSGLLDLKKTMIKKKQQRNAWYKSIGCTTGWSGFFKTCNSTAQRGSFSRYSSMPVISPDEVGDFFAKSQKLGRCFFSYVSYPFLHFISISTV